MTDATITGPATSSTGVTFRYADPHGELAAVRLRQELRRPRLGPAFTREPAAGAWVVDLPRLGVDRMEYQFQLERAGQPPTTVCDPGNPLRAAGPFGDKSVVEFPGYAPPAWLRAAPRPPGLQALTIKSRALGTPLPVALWRGAEAAAGEPLPLLVVHDGPEYARFAALLEFLAGAVAARRLPPLRAALLAPVDRNGHYAALPAYARALAHEVLPALAAVAPTPPGRRFRVGMGASLGALAMLHAHRAVPAAFGALFLQSGSFFQAAVDTQEAWLPAFGRICGFVARLLAGCDTPAPAPIPVTLTCGAVEENLTGNRAVASALRGEGYQVRLGECRDAHNWVAWRDAYDPHLLDLLAGAWHAA